MKIDTKSCDNLDHLPEELGSMRQHYNLFFTCIFLGNLNSHLKVLFLAFRLTLFKPLESDI